MDNSHFRDARKVITTTTDIDPVAFAQVSALLAIADAIDSLDDAIRNRPWEP